MDVKDFYYDLPQELIAQDPLEDRSSSRLMVLDKITGEVEHRHFKDIVEYLRPGDCLVINNTKVIPARLYGVKEGTEAKIEILLLKRKENDIWETLVKPGKKCKIGTKIVFGEGILTGEVVDIVEEGNRLIQFHYEGIFEEILDRLGQMPLPPYITHQLQDKNRYQTVYAKYDGSAAAPTAGLHFTPELLQQVEASSVNDPEETEPVGEFQQGMNVLNMEDVREEERARVQEETSLEMESMLADARAQAEEILQNAREQADEIRQQAQEEGRNAGFEQGQAEALKHLQEEALRQQEQFEQQQQKLKEQEEALEPKYAELMGALIEKITGVLCEDKKDVIVYLIHQALNQLEKTKSVTLRVSKPDMLTVSAQKEQLRSCVSGEVDFDITEDDSLQENQCIIETDQRIIDCSLDVQLQNLKDQIRMLTIM